MALNDALSVAGDGEVVVGEPNGVHVVEVTEEEVVASTVADEISPLLTEPRGSKPRGMNIFSVSYPRKEPYSKDMTSGAAETEVAFLNHIIWWAWNDSRYSGFICMASSSTIYYIMDVLMDVFPVQSIPIFETVFTRCFILVIMSILWLRRMGQPFLVPTSIRKTMIMRSITGFLSLLSFIYSVQNLHLSYAVLLNFAMPIFASFGAKIILQEKFSLVDIVGSACSFLGLLIILETTHFIRGSLNEPDQASKTLIPSTSSLIYPILAGVFSSLLGGISCCLIRLGAKASNQPVYTVLSFGILVCPLSALCALTFQEIVLPSPLTLVLMTVLGILAFLAEMLAARGLQLERISKITNILYLKVILSQLVSVAFLGREPTFHMLMGCLLIIASLCSTLFFARQKENE
ncbi:probable transport protein YPL264C [Typha angustifolia]|uniref:probable transport protein YPL264C n=1 Tax=Typha angustifolia TaxID=59011 RepID=UPI003C2E7FE0